MKILISTKDAAAELGISQRRVEALITSGRLEAEMIGGTYVIRRSSLDSVRERKAGRPRKTSGDHESVGE